VYINTIILCDIVFTIASFAKFEVKCIVIIVLISKRFASPVKKDARAKRTKQKSYL